MLLKRLLILAGTLTLVACKLHLEMPEEGGTVVVAPGGSGGFGALEICGAGETCIYDVSDQFFDQSFIAKADEGFLFDEWKERDRGFCGGRKRANCRLYTTTFNDAPALVAFLRRPEEIFYLEPVFVRDEGQGACRYTAITSAGRFKACQAGLDQASCNEVRDSMDSFLSAQACEESEPRGYCRSFYGTVYYDSGNVNHLRQYCETIVGGTWRTL